VWPVFNGCRFLNTLTTQNSAFPLAVQLSHHFSITQSLDLCTIGLSEIVIHFVFGYGLIDRVGRFLTHVLCAMGH